jgi:hypothetical protein
VVLIEVKCSLRQLEAGLIERPECLLQIRSSHRAGGYPEQLVDRPRRFLHRPDDLMRGCDG